MKPKATLIKGDCCTALQTLEPESIDFCLFSPPYDNLRTYTGVYSFDYPVLGDRLYRVMKPGGVCSVVIQDSVVNGSRSLTSFRLTIDWVERIGFRMFERIVWRKDGQPGRYNKRFRLDHEDVLVFSKGEPGTFDKSEILIPCKHAGSKMHGYRKSRSKDRANEYAPVVAEFKCPGTVWYIPQSRVEQNSVKSKHPATFPDKLARDLILCFSKVGDTVLDPMVGSGTTCVEAAKAERHSIGIDLAYQNIQIARLVKEAGIRPTIKLPTLPRRK